MTAADSCSLSTESLPPTLAPSTLELSRSDEQWLLTDRLNRIDQWFAYWLIEGGPKALAAAVVVPQPVR